MGANMAIRSVFAVWNSTSYLKCLFLTNEQLSRITKYYVLCNAFSSQTFHARKFYGRSVFPKSNGIFHDHWGFNVAGVGLERRSFVHTSKITQSKMFRMNESITAKNVRLIDQDGKNLGVMSLKSALEIGRNGNYLVVEVSSSESATVCKLTSEQQLYTKMKEDKKKHVKTSKTKEIKLTGKISDHDLEIKLKKVREFLEGHNSVKVFVAHRKRQNTSMDDKQAVINNIAEKISDLGVLQGEPRPVGNGLRSVFVPHPRK